MNVNKKTFFVILLAGLLFFTFSAPLFAKALWYKGTVTKAPWVVNTFNWVEIDKKTYTLMLKDDQFERHIKDNDGRWSGSKWPISSLQVGEKVVFKADDRRVFELYVAQ
jgi:hypothetical protein